MTLTEFLLARIAEDEAVAREATPGPWIANDQGDGYWEVSSQASQDVIVSAGWPSDPAGGACEADAGHIAQWSPDRVLAESSSKRRIIAWHRLIDGLDTEDRPVRGCGNCIASGAVPPYIIAGPCMTLRLLALPYADHPDYDPAWAL